MSLPRPLDGIVVVALEQAVAAPFCTARLADAGARVIKIERPEGDFARGYDDVAKGQASYFVWLNRGKESVVLDLTLEDDRRRLARLVAGADVFVQNLKPGALARLGFDIAELRRKHPALICCSISGYGDTGPLAGRKAYDLLIQAESGLASITGGPEGPARVGISIVDIATGATAQVAVLEALIGRGRSGLGADIHVSMFDVMADWLTVPLLNAEGGHPPKRIGLAHPSISPYGVFAARDGAQILISIQNEREWRTFCRDVLLDETIADDLRFSTNVARVAHRAETDGMVARAFGALSRSDVIDRLTRSDTAFAEVNDMAALSAHPHLRRTTVATPNGPVSYPAPAALFDGASRPCGAVPAIGQNHEDDAHAAATAAGENPD
ncbi:MAG: CaiB/BaiF CoA transferase family protein [Xanthobacteraceae bacterium]